MSEMIMTPQQFERYKAFETLYGEKNDPSGTTQTTFNPHGLNPTETSLGIFGAPGVEPDMWQTIVRANGSFMNSLDFRATRIENPLYEIVAGIGAGTGANPLNSCGDPPHPGSMTVCQQSYPFGKVFAGTDVIEGAEIGGRYTRADLNRRVRPRRMMSPFSPDVIGRAGNQNSIAWKVLSQLDVDLNRQHETVLMQGLRTAGHTGAGSVRYFRKQPDGLDRWVRTGYTDVESGEDCDALDSCVRTFGTNITGTGTDGTIVDYLTDMYTKLETDLGGMGYNMAATTFAFVMHPRMWRPITREWPCSYLTMGCNTLVNNDGQRLNISAESERRMQDDMFNGKYLMIDGMRIPVLFSWEVPIVNTGLDLWNGPVYLVTPTLNGEETIWVEYFDMGNEEQNEFYNLATGGNMDTTVSNGGLYRVERRMKGCLEYTFVSKWRLMFTAPFAACRLDGIEFNDRVRAQDPQPGESYYAAGGTTSRTVY